MSGPLYWIWGAGPKTGPAKAELERIAGAPRGSLDDLWRGYRAGTESAPPISDLAPGAVDRLRNRLRSAPARSFFFGAPSLQQMSGGLAIRTQRAGQRASKVVFEDHGFVGGTPPAVGLFFGRDFVTLRNLPRYRRWFEQLRDAIEPGGGIYLVHCDAASDNCRLMQAISRIAQLPVYGADAIQDVGNQAMEGQAYKVTGNHVQRIRSFPQAVLHFD
ncbi:MAG: hypothetical protein ACE37F_19245 [Nannocystaceae bacterium]|nr:hypothetical protein [bacterium]